MKERSEPLPGGAGKEAGERWTDSGIPLKPVYVSSDLPAPGPEEEIPGQFPYSRGVYRDMYRGRLWTMRQYAGFGTALESNARFRFLLSQGQTGLSVALDLPTQLGYDSDDPRVEDEVGRVGVALDTLADMEDLFRDIPLSRISTNFTINSTAAIILAMYCALAEKQGIAADQIRGTVQNDMIKEYLARNTYILPIAPSLRIVADIIEFCAARLPHFNPISVSGYHIREAGASGVMELALVMEAGTLYVQEMLRRGMGVDDFAPRLSFHFSSGPDFFEEIAKYRAARRMWAQIMRHRFQCTRSSSERLRVFAGGNGLTLCASEPLNNIVRATMQCLVGVLGGAQAIHVPAYDEAFAIPTEESARLGLRTQQIIAHESGIPATADPLGGSYLIEYLTAELERRAREFLQDLEERGGLVACIQNGALQRMISDRAYEREKQIQCGERPVVGVNCFSSGQTEEIRLSEMDPGTLDRQRASLREVKEGRDGAEVHRALAALRRSVEDGKNIMEDVIRAVKAYATLGEITAIFRKVYGEFQDPPEWG